MPEPEPFVSALVVLFFSAFGPLLLFRWAVHVFREAAR